MGGLLPKAETAKRTEDGACASGRWAFGVSEMQGWRRGMEDAHLALPDFDPERRLGLFGVFDGHGGSAVAKVAARKMPETLRGLPSFKKGQYKEALYEAFLLVDAFLDSADGRKEIAELVALDGSAEEDEDDDMEGIEELMASGKLSPDDIKHLQEDADNDDDAEDGEAEDPDFEEGEEGEEEAMEGEEEEEEGDANSVWANGEGPDGMGTTAVVALVCGGESPEVIVANAGDSRCVLACGSSAQNMSRDHKPTLKSEKKRIHKAGGFVTDEGRVDGNLNLSRALGDFAYKKDTSLKATEQKISAEAEVRSRALTETDRYLALGCDGIFEKVTSQQLLDFLLPRLAPRQRRRGRAPAPLSATCSAFLDENVAKNPAKEQGLGCDNMTLILVDLHADSVPTACDAASPAVNGKASAAGPCKVNGSSVSKRHRPQHLITKDGARITSRSPGRRRRLLLALRRRAPPRAAARAAAGGS